jgi:hypothetical protein
VKGGVSHGYKTPRLEQMVDGIIGFTGQGRIASIGSPGLEPDEHGAGGALRERKRFHGGCHGLHQRVPRTRSPQ